MSVSDKILELRTHREAIREAINGKGVVLAEGSPMSDYAGAINGISGGGEDISDLFKSISIPTLSGVELFKNSTATELDLRALDTSNMVDMTNMFNGSQATIGYARTQADADRFNASSGKPAGLVFVVKGT